MAPRNTHGDIAPNVADILRELASFTNDGSSNGLDSRKEYNIVDTHVQQHDSRSESVPQKAAEAQLLQDSTQKPANASQPPANGFAQHLLKLQEITEAAKKQTKESKESSKDKTSTPAKQSASPANITEWAPALRHVSRLAAQDPFLESAVRKV
jgi:hypothetical protein